MSCFRHLHKSPAVERTGPTSLGDGRESTQHSAPGAACRDKPKGECTPLDPRKLVSRTCRVLAAAILKWQSFFTVCRTFRISTLPQNAVKNGTQHTTKFYYAQTGRLVNHLIKHRSRVRHKTSSDRGGKRAEKHDSPRNGTLFPAIACSPRFSSNFQLILTWGGRDKLRPTPRFWQTPLPRTPMPAATRSAGVAAPSPNFTYRRQPDLPTTFAGPRPQCGRAVPSSIAPARAGRKGSCDTPATARETSRGATPPRQAKPAAGD